MGAILHDHERGSMEVYPEQDIYSYLRRMREQEGLSLGELAERMDVRESFLEMLEDGELGRKLGPGYVRSIVVRYGACLGLDSDELLDAVQRQLSGEPAVLSALSRGVTPVQEPERATKRPEDVWSAPY